MNELYFACCDCKTYIDAGYRWAYWELEHAGVVSRKEAISVDSVLAADKYWNPPMDKTSRWLYEDVFPPLREFFKKHRTHRIVFGDREQVAPGDDYYLDWMQVGYCLQPSPRYLVEILGYKTWEEVDQHMTNLADLAPAWWECTWWGDPPPREKGKRRFEQLVGEKRIE